MTRPDYRYTLNFVDAWSVDEIVVLDVTRPGEGQHNSFVDVIRRFASNCFVPLSAGGGIRTMDDVSHFLDLGADKVVVNSGAIERPEFITEIAKLYGSQCVVLSIDAKKMKSGEYEAFSHFGTHATGMTPTEWARRAEALGVGEIMTMSIEKDGSVQGYDLESCKQVADAVSVPVLISGGAGNWKHFVQGIEEGGASAVCTSNIYHFTETSIQSAKAFLGKAGISVRL